MIYKTLCFIIEVLMYDSLIVSKALFFRQMLHDSGESRPHGPWRDYEYSLANLVKIVAAKEMLLTFYVNLLEHVRCNHCSAFFIEFSALCQNRMLPV